jgi:hypothetical protein
MERYTVVVCGGHEWFGPPPKAMAFSSGRAHLHAAIRDTLAFVDEGETARVSLFDLPPKAKVPVIISEVTFTKRDGRARDLEGDTDWLMPFLRPALTVYDRA